MIYELAGIIGVDPAPFTLRELVFMVKGLQRDQWNHTSHVLCILANANRDPKRIGAFKPADFNPTIARRRVPDVPITVLRDVFIDGKRPNVVGGE